MDDGMVVMMAARMAVQSAVMKVVKLGFYGVVMKAA